MNPELVRGADFDVFFGIPVIKEPLIKSRPSDLAPNLLASFCQIALKILEIRQYSCGFFAQFA